MQQGTKSLAGALNLLKFFAAERREWRVTELAITAGLHKNQVDGPEVSREEHDAMRLQLGLDQSLIIQYLKRPPNVLHGDLGTSISFWTPVLEVIFLRLVPNPYLMIGGPIIAVIIDVPAGVLAAIHNNQRENLTRTQEPNRECRPCINGSVFET